jgi:hypothetical protein
MGRRTLDCLAVVALLMAVASGALGECQPRQPCPIPHLLPWAWSIRRQLGLHTGTPQCSQHLSQPPHK